MNRDYHVCNVHLYHVLNFRFAVSLTKGKFAPTRPLLAVMDLLLFADMLALMISAVMLSGLSPMSFASEYLPMAYMLFSHGN